MQIAIGWVLLILGGSLYIAQLISSINFPLAQRLGLQEKSDVVDPVLLRSEKYVAYWDLLTLGWLPLAGVFMITNHEWWPIVSLIGGAIYLDASGREFAKNMSFSDEGKKVGNGRQRVFFLSTYAIMIIIAILLIVYSVNSLVISS